MMTEPEAWRRVAAARHGVLGTIHPRRGVDLVPVVYGVGLDRTVLVPVDTVKSKRSGRLQRLVNISADARCTLLVEHYDDDDWRGLWWVRVSGTGAVAGADELDAYRSVLAERYRQYRDPAAIVGGLVISPDQVVGWSAI